MHTQAPFLRRNAGYLMLTLVSLAAVTNANGTGWTWAQKTCAAAHYTCMNGPEWFRPDACWECYAHVCHKCTGWCHKYIDACYKKTKAEPNMAWLTDMGQCAATHWACRNAKPGWLRNQFCQQCSETCQYRCSWCTKNEQECRALL